MPVRVALGWVVRVGVEVGGVPVTVGVLVKVADGVLVKVAVRVGVDVGRVPVKVADGVAQDVSDLSVRVRSTSFRGVWPAVHTSFVPSASTALSLPGLPAAVMGTMFQVVPF